MGVVLIGYRARKSLAYWFGDEVVINPDKNRNIGAVSTFEKIVNKHLKHNKRNKKINTK